AYADDGRYARLLHRDAVHGVGGLHGSWVVRDDDELRLFLEFRQEAHVAAHVRIIQRRVHLVEQAERARLGEEDGKEERHRHERAFAGPEQMNPLRPFAARRGVDLDFAPAGPGLVRAPDVTPAAATSALD